MIPRHDSASARRRAVFATLAAIALPVVALPPVPGNAQGTKADYERAAVLPTQLRDKVLRANIRPQWITEANGKQGHRFWYRSDLADGRREFIIVDPEAAEPRRRAFDHAAVAAALKGQTGKEVPADKLPVEWLVVDADETVRLQASGKSYRWSPAAKTLTPIEGVLNVLTPIPTTGGRTFGLRSRNTGPQTEIIFVNKTDGEVALFWVDTDGGRQPYGKLAAGESRRMNTYAGHAWLALDASDRPIVGFIASDSPASAIIERTSGRATPPPPFPLDAEDEVADREYPDVTTPTMDSLRLAREEREPIPNAARATITFRDNNAFLKDPDTGMEVPLTGDAGPERVYAERFRGTRGYYWSPDGKKVVLFRFAPGEEHKVTIVESSPRDQVQPKVRVLDYHKPGDKIPTWKPRLFDVSNPASPREIPIKDDLFPNPYDLGELRWSVDSARFSFLYNQRGHQVVRLVGVDAATGEAKTIAENTSPTFVDYAQKMFIQYLDETNELVWMSERDGWCHLYLYDLTTGRLKNQITKGEWVVRGVDRVDTEKKQIWFRAGGIVPGQDPYQVHYCRVNFDGTGLTRLTEGDGTHTVSYSPNGKYLVDTWSRVDMAPVTELRRADDGKLITALEKGDASALLKTGWRYPERFVAKARDGVTDIYGIIVYPTNFDPKKKYPVIEEIYAGPQGAFVPKTFSSWMGNKNALAELGFIVVQIDGMGTNWRSKAFHDVCWKNLGDSGLPDRVLWIKAAAKTRPFMDLTRVGIFGGSAGGQNSTRAMLTHGDFYKVGVSDCGCHDNRMDKIWWNELWMGWPVGKEYEESSNVTYARQLTGKLMLVVGELDTNVDPASTMQVVNALIKADKDFDLLVVPGGGHGSAESPYGRRRRADYFVRHLLGVEPRAK
jgi:dipeptidyl aminopeptidase/acylaminoacyl peptidase